MGPVFLISLAYVISYLRGDKRTTVSDSRYEGPLGLVEKPEDEWIEWAIIDDMDDDDDW